MGKIFLPDFLNVCHCIDPEYYVFSTENQKDVQSCMFHGKAKYSEVSVSFSPNRIYFKGDDGLLCLKRIKYIKVGREIPGVSVPITIVCEDENCKDNCILILAVLSSDS